MRFVTEERQSLIRKHPVDKEGEILRLYLQILEQVQDCHIVGFAEFVFSNHWTRLWIFQEARANRIQATRAPGDPLTSSGRDRTLSTLPVLMRFCAG